jgi:hypothetical protein
MSPPSHQDPAAVQPDRSAVAGKAHGESIGATRPAGLILLAGAVSLGLFLLQAVLPQMAWLAWPLLWLSTLFHELGHGVAAIAVGGELRQLAVYADGSGVAAHIGAYSSLERAVIAAAGPLGAPLAGLLLFLSLGHRLAARVLLLALGLLLAVALLMWVRNGFGLLLVAVAAALSILVALRAGERLLYLVVAFVAVEMSLSSFGRLDTLFSPTARTGSGDLPSDSAQIASALVLPYWFWGAVLAAASVLIVVAGLLQALRLSRASSAP